MLQLIPSPTKKNTQAVFQGSKVRLGEVESKMKLGSVKLDEAYGQFVGPDRVAEEALC